MAVGELHPDRLLEQLTASELLSWWVYYQDEPWGDERADLREMAVLGVSNGVDGFRLPWPYAEIEPDADELLSEYRRLKEVDDGNSGKD